MSKKHTFAKALVTGATSGIGKSIAKLLADQGIELILTGRNEVALYELKASLSSMVSVHILRADLADRVDREKVVSLVHIHTPDLVINNAGLGYYGPLVTLSNDDAQDIIEVNCTSLAAITQASAFSLLEKKRRGTIVNISSMLGFYPSPNHAIYAASKAFVNSFSIACDTELRLQGIRVLASCPGHVATQFRSRASKGSAYSTKHFMTLEADHVAACVWKQILQGKRCVTIDFRYKIVRFLLAFVPQRVLLFFMKKGMEDLSSSP